MERHYTLNSNFEVTSDSLMLQQLPLVDVLPVFKGVTAGGSGVYDTTC